MCAASKYMCAPSSAQHLPRDILSPCDDRHNRRNTLPLHLSRLLACGQRVKEERISLAVLAIFELTNCPKRFRGTYESNPDYHGHNMMSYHYCGEVRDAQTSVEMLTYDHTTRECFP